jgi:hypothetical protein
VREIRVHRQSFPDGELLHQDEAHAIDEAVILILVTLQIFEGCTLLFSACPVDAREASR